MKKENGIQKIFNWILKIIKVLFSFLFGLFSPNKKNKKTKQKEEILLKQIKAKQINKSSISSDEEDIHTLQDEIKKEIQNVYLSYKKEEPKEKQELKENLNKLNETILPIILKEVHEDKITTPTNLKERIMEEVNQTELEEEKIEVLDIEEKELEPILLTKEEKKIVEDNIKIEIKKVYIKELKIDELYITKKEAELLKLLIEKITPLVVKEIEANQIANHDELEQEIKKEIKKYFCEELESLIDYALVFDEKIEKYKEKILQEMRLSNDTKEYVEEVKEDYNIEILTKKSININEISKKEERQKLEDKSDKEPKKENEEQKNLQKQLDLAPIERGISKLTEETKIEVQKTELEDKEYEKLEEKITLLLIEIRDLKTKNYDENTKIKLRLEEKKLIQMKENLEIDKTNTLEKEKSMLNERITIEEITGVEQELKNMYLEYQNDYQKYLLPINNYNDLSIEKQKEIEKTLLLLRLKKANKALSFSFLLALPFIRNRYFSYLTGGLLVSHHLNIYKHLLHKQNAIYTEEEIHTIETGEDALELAYDVTVRNLDTLVKIETETIKNCPELSYNKTFLKETKQLKNTLMHNEKKLSKKQKVIEKYHLKTKKLVRILKKKQEEEKKTI